MMDLKIELLEWQKNLKVGYEMEMIKESGVNSMETTDFKPAALTRVKAGGNFVDPDTGVWGIFETDSKDIIECNGYLKRIIFLTGDKVELNEIRPQELQLWDKTQKLVQQYFREKF